MTNSLTFQLDETFNKLMEKTEQLQQAGLWNPEQKERLITGSDRLTEVITYLERQQKEESRLAKRLEKTLARLNNVLDKKDQEAIVAKGDVADSIESMARTFQVIGQLTEIIAGSMQIISKAFRENKTAAPNPENGDAKNDTIDLTNILTQLNSLVDSVVGKRKSSSSEQEASSEQSNYSEAVTDGDNKRTHVN